MKQILLVLFSTLVFTKLWASSPEVKPVLPSETETEVRSAEDLDAFSLSPSPPVPPATLSEKEYYYAFEHSLSPRFGYQYDFHDKKNKFSGGFSYNHISPIGESYEFNLDFLGGKGRFDIAKKKILNYSGRLRYNFKYMLAVDLNPKDGLATILKYQNYYIAAGTGFEFTIFDPASIRLDIEIFQSTERTIAAAFIGYAFAW